MNTKQAQLLLNYLGFTCSIDGIEGQETRRQTQAFQKHYNKMCGDDDAILVDGIRGNQTEKALVDSVYFGYNVTQPDFSGYISRSECACKCGKCGGFPVEPDMKVVEILNGTRCHYGKPLIVSSFVRCVTHNANVGGVYNSKHLKGKAADFTVQGQSAQSLLSYVRTIPGIVYAYAIDSRYVHIEI